MGSSLLISAQWLPILTPLPLPDAKADSLLEAVEKYVLSHESPSDVFNELLRIIGEKGSIARNVASMISKV